MKSHVYSWKNLIRKWLKIDNINNTYVDDNAAATVFAPVTVAVAHGVDNVGEDNDISDNESKVHALNRKQIIIKSYFLFTRVRVLIQNITLIVPWSPGIIYAIHLDMQGAICVERW